MKKAQSISIWPPSACKTSTKSYLAVLWYGYQKLGIPSSVDFFWKMWQVMWQTPEILNLALFIGGVGVLLSVWQVLSNQKRALSRYFDPHIEIIKPKEV